jgi:hypothetical protein
LEKLVQILPDVEGFLVDFDIVLRPLWAASVGKSLVFGRIFVEIMVRDAANDVVGIISGQSDESYLPPLLDQWFVLEEPVHRNPTVSVYGGLTSIRVERTLESFERNHLEQQKTRI